METWVRKLKTQMSKVKTMPIYLPKAKDTAVKAVLAAGEVLKANFGKAVIKNKKDKQDVTTDADYKAEEVIIRTIEKNFPEHNIISEESGDKEKRSDYCWYIDPLDGTKEYLRGIPYFNTSATLEFKDEIVATAVHRPITGELFYSCKNSGSFLNNKKVCVSNKERLHNSFIYTHFPSYKVNEEIFGKVWSTLKKLVFNSYRVRPFAEDIYSLCLVAMGAADGYILMYEAAKWWDVAGGLLMVKEAGGKVTNLYGKPIEPHNLKEGIIASNGKIHQQILEIIKKNL